MSENLCNVSKAIDFCSSLFSEDSKKNNISARNFDFTIYWNKSVNSYLVEATCDHYFYDDKLYNDIALKCLGSQKILEMKGTKIYFGDKGVGLDRNGIEFQAMYMDSSCSVQLMMMAYFFCIFINCSSRGDNLFFCLRKTKSLRSRVSEPVRISGIENTWGSAIAFSPEIHGEKCLEIIDRTIKYIMNSHLDQMTSSDKFTKGISYMDRDFLYNRTLSRTSFCEYMMKEITMEYYDSITKNKGK